MALRDQRFEGEVVTTVRGDDPRLPRILLQMLKEYRAAVAENLVKGHSNDFAEYRHACGKIEGLDIAINFANQAKAKLEA